MPLTSSTESGTIAEEGAEAIDNNNNTTSRMRSRRVVVKVAPVVVKAAGIGRREVGQNKKIKNKKQMIRTIRTLTRKIFR